MHRWLSCIHTVECESLHPFSLFKTKTLYNLCNMYCTKRCKTCSKHVWFSKLTSVTDGVILHEQFISLAASTRVQTHIQPFSLQPHWTRLTGNQLAWTWIWQKWMWLEPWFVDLSYSLGVFLPLDNLSRRKADDLVCGYSPSKWALRYLQRLSEVRKSSE